MSGWGNTKFGSWGGFGKTSWNTYKSDCGNSKQTLWSNPYNTRQTQSFKSYNDYYDESSEDDSSEHYFSEDSISEDSWDYDRDTYEDSEGFIRDIETNRKVTKIERSNKAKTYCLYPHDNIPGETKRNNETTKIWKDKK